VIAAASLGAILGDNIGFRIGRGICFRLLLRYGHFVGLTEPRIRVGQELFLKHGGKIVFFGRFIALLRILPALLAGVNRMSLPRFLVFNAAGAILWATVFGLGAYYLGEKIEHLTKPAALVFAVVGLGALVIWVLVQQPPRQRRWPGDRPLRCGLPASTFVEDRVRRAGSGQRQ
jgi:membrane protein DedA with SNARE-associated domain